MCAHTCQATGPPGRVAEKARRRHQEADEEVIAQQKREKNRWRKDSSHLSLVNLLLPVCVASVCLSLCEERRARAKAKAAAAAAMADEPVVQEEADSSSDDEEEGEPRMAGGSASGSAAAAPGAYVV